MMVELPVKVLVSSGHSSRGSPTPNTSPGALVPSEDSSSCQKARMQKEVVMDFSLPVNSGPPWGAQRPDLSWVVRKASLCSPVPGMSVFVNAPRWLKC
jgi:hypothetical protein